MGGRGTWAEALSVRRSAGTAGKRGLRMCQFSGLKREERRVGELGGKRGPAAEPGTPESVERRRPVHWPQTQWEDAKSAWPGVMLRGEFNCNLNE